VAAGVGLVAGACAKATDMGALISETHKTVVATVALVARLT